MGRMIIGLQSKQRSCEHVGVVGINCGELTEFVKIV